jgi:transcription elongation factor GreA
MNNNNKIKTTELTPEGFEELKAELENLVNDKLPKAIKRVADAREYGDLSENSEYHDARDDRNLIDIRIAKIEKVLKKATIVKATRNKQKVGMGSQVIIRLKGKNSKTKTLHVVGEYEADPVEGKISSVSPLGKALMDKKKGDEVTYQAPAGEITYTITQIK